MYFQFSWFFLNCQSERWENILSHANMIHASELVNKINNEWIKIVVIVTNNGTASIILSIFPYLYFGIRWSSTENSYSRSERPFCCHRFVTCKADMVTLMAHHCHTIGHDFAPVVVFISMWTSHWRQLGLVRRDPLVFAPRFVGMNRRT